jgi:Rps23 Pro-64 3,4-dihydroxylase Tpa1-like proline 4-hydroxylase
MDPVSRCKGMIRYSRYENYESPHPVLLETIERVLQRDALRIRAERIPDLAWRLFAAGVSSAVDVQLTSYAAGGRYVWHTDHLVRNRTHNFILYMTNPDEFRGGVLQVSLAPPSRTARTSEKGVHAHMKITPRRNRLVIMPSHLVHRVTPVKGLAPDAPFWAGRVTINGHIRIALPSTFGR